MCYSPNTCRASAHDTAIMNLQPSSSSWTAAYIYFESSGAQTWSLENICMNMTSDSNQVKIDESSYANVTYTKKVNVESGCAGFPTGTAEPERPESPSLRLNPFKD